MNSIASRAQSPGEFRKRVQASQNEIINIANRASLEGLSYGKYQEKKYLEQTKIIRKL